MRTVLVWLLLTTVVAAEDGVVCDPTHLLVPNAVTRYAQTVDVVFEASEGRTFTLVWSAPNVSMTPSQVATMNTLRGQLDSLQGVPRRYWKCADLTVPADGILESVTEMSQAEKDAMDAPALAQQALSNEFETLSSQLEADDTAWSTLTTAQKLAVAKKLLRREVLQRRLGQ